ncbi:hypothetical protein HW132_11580 [Brasilonema sp. CT11]|nr:hypothetical protein [Brasilonema sp. CT11]
MTRVCHKLCDRPLGDRNFDKLYTEKIWGTLDDAPNFDKVLNGLFCRSSRSDKSL